MVSGMTSYTSYSTYSAKAAANHAKNKAKKGLSRFRRNAQKKIASVGTPSSGSPY